MNGIYEAYQEILSMTDEEVFLEYGDIKSEVIADIERQIELYENYDKSEYGDMVYGVDPAFSSFESVNSMFV